MVSEPVHIIIHPGFHKTGTSALQHCLRLNRNALQTHARIWLLPQIKDGITICRKFAVSKDPSDLYDLQSAFETAFESYHGFKPLILSCEGLCGRTPGQDGVADYNAALAMLPVLAQTLKQKFGDRLKLEFFFTLRQSKSWLCSAWRHNLLGTDLTLDWDSFQKEYAHAGALDTMANQLAVALEPALCHKVWLEDYSDNRLGIAAALFDVLNIPQATQDTLQAPKDRNIGISAEVADHFRSLNKADMSKTSLQSLKQAILAKS